MRKKKRQESEIEHVVQNGLNYYVVAFLDILGQRDLLRRMDEIELTNPFPDDLTSLLPKTLGLVTTIRRSFRQFTEELPLTINISMLSKEQQREYFELRATNVKTQLLGDSFIYYIPLSDPMPRPITSIYITLAACATFLPLAIATGFPIRGAIDIGWASELRDGEIYGPALMRVFDLESQAAKYPRVLIGERLMQYLSLHSRDTDSTDLREQAKIHMSALCQALVTCDFDGRTILNYLGDHARDTFADTPVNRQRIVGEVLPKAYRFITKELDRFRQLNDEKLTPRYEQLKAYFDISLPIWGIEPDDIV